MVVYCTGYLKYTLKEGKVQIGGQTDRKINMLLHFIEW